MPTKIFFSYSHKDENLRDQLEAHLSMLKREGLIESWHDRRIIAGSPLKRSINERLEDSDVLLLLVSPDFLASDECYDKEMKRALERHQSGKIRIIPVILRPCDWHPTPFGSLLAVPRDGKPVTTWQNTDEAFLDVAKSIRNAIEKMTARETQGITLNVAQGPERLDKRLSARRERFQQEFECLENPKNAFGIRFTGTPVGDEIRFERVLRNGAIVKELKEPWHSVLLQQGDKDLHVLDDKGILSFGARCPMLRAAREESDWGHGNTNRFDNSYRELHCDGLIEIGFVSCSRDSDRGGKLYLPPSLPFVIFPNLVVWVDRIRNQALAPTVEYALEVEIRAIGSPVGVVDDYRLINTPYATILRPSLINFPRYSLGNPDEVSELFALFFRDFWNSLGKDVGTEKCIFTIKDWPSG